jgi:hypothetical protein
MPSTSEFFVNAVLGPAVVIDPAVLDLTGEKFALAAENTPFPRAVRLEITKQKHQIDNQDDDDHQLQHECSPLVELTNHELI